MTYRAWRQCGRKKRYRDEHTVNLYRKVFEKERGTKLDYYWCNYCNGFHLTSKEWSIADLSLLEAVAQ